jgi:hypothetical protein
LTLTLRGFLLPAFFVQTPPMRMLLFFLILTGLLVLAALQVLHSAHMLSQAPGTHQTLV